MKRTQYVNLSGNLLILVSYVCRNCIEDEYSFLFMPFSARE